jgi:hypothetical protein
VTARRRLAFLSRALWATAQRVGTAPGVRWSVENILPGAGIAVALLALAAMAGEFALRVKTPFLANNWPIKFDGSYGFNFVPGAKVELTNHLDFWAENIVNSLGFLDREPPSTEYPGTGVCRIAFFGDSMIEAAQVPLEQKVQIQLERFANESHGGKKFQTLAFGFSGTGQANQVPFYDVFAKRFHPNVVVLVFVSNDFANNSSVLESIRNGWDPFHPPRLFFDRDATGGFQSIRIDPQWLDKVFPSERQVSSWRTPLHRTLITTSYLYNWIYALLSLRFPDAARWLDGTSPLEEVYADRQRVVTQRWPSRVDFIGWNFPHDWDMDTVFSAQQLAPVFQDALAFTGHALDEFILRSRQDGSNLMVLADKSLYLQTRRSSAKTDPKINSVNPLSDNAALLRLEALTRRRQIPLVDL